MSGYLIRISGYRLNKAGELVPDVRRLSISPRQTDSRVHDPSHSELAQ